MLLNLFGERDFSRILFLVVCFFFLVSEEGFGKWSWIAMGCTVSACASEFVAPTELAWVCVLVGYEADCVLSCFFFESRALQKGR